MIKDIIQDIVQDTVDDVIYVEDSESDWLLDDGTWDDTKIWKDSETWND